MTSMTISPTSSKATYTVKEIASQLSAEFIGDGDRLINCLCSLEEPLQEGLTFFKGKSVYQLNEKLIHNGQSKCAAVLVSDEWRRAELSPQQTYIFVKDPHRSLLDLIELFYNAPAGPDGISDKAEIHPTALVSSNVKIGAYSVVGAGVILEENVTLHPHVVIYPYAHIRKNTIIHSGAVIREYCEVGADSIIQNGAVIGGDGFGYIPDAQIGIKAVPQIGKTVLGDRVDIGANACIDRAALGTTKIGYATKIDNLVQIGHNTHIGKFSIVCGSSAIAGSCKIGDKVTIGGNVAVADHLTIVDECRFIGRSTVTADILEKGDYGGLPAVRGHTYRRNMVSLGKLSDIIKDLRGEIKELRAKIGL